MGPNVEELSPIPRTEWSKYGNRMLRLAVRSGDITTLERLEDFTLTDLKEQFLLKLAVECGNASVVSFFHEKGLTSSDARTFSNCVLRIATHNGDVPILNALRKMGLTYLDVIDETREVESSLEIAQREDSDDILHLFHKWKIEDAAASKEFVDSCASCLDTLLVIGPDKKAAATLIAITDCNHNYHDSCLEQWLAKSRTCPVCDEPIKGYAAVKIVEGTSEETAHEIIGSYIRR